MLKDPILIFDSTPIEAKTIFDPANVNLSLDPELDNELDLSFMEGIEKGLSETHIKIDQSIDSALDLCTKIPHEQEQDQTNQCNNGDDKGKTESGVFCL